MRGTRRLFVLLAAACSAGFLCSPAGAGPNPLRFDAPQGLATFSSAPDSIAVGDVTGDGRDDIVMSTTYQLPLTPNDWKLFLWEQRADGTLAPPVRFDTHAVHSIGMGLAVGDLDGDGVGDVAMASVNGIHVYFARDGTLSAPVLIPGTEESMGLELADIDGDGDNDLVSNRAGPGLLLARNTGVGFTVSTIGAESNFEIEVGDLTGDGRQDVVGQQFGETRVYRQLPGGTFAAPVVYEAVYRSDGIAVADLNGDGRADLARVGGGNDGWLEILHQNAAGLLDPPVRLASYDNPRPLEAADMDEDGRADLVTSHSGWWAVGFYVQGSAGVGSEDLYEVPYTSKEAQTIAVGDVNGDGLEDFVMSGPLVMRQLPRVRPPAPGDYRIEESSGATLIPGSTWIEMCRSDCVVRVELPFPIRLYERWYSEAWAGSDGALHFDDPQLDFRGHCYPSHFVGDGVFPLRWPLEFYAPVHGVFTATLGEAPNRRFVVEWRAHAQVSRAVNFEVIFHENSGRITTIYGHMGFDLDWDRPTAGIQRDRGTGTAYSCGDKPLTEGLRVDYVPEFATHPCGGTLADFDCDGDSEIGIFRPSSALWALRGLDWANFGGSTDLPVAADYDGDGDTDIAVYQPGSGLWAIRGQAWAGFGGNAGDIPVPADYDGDGDAEIAIFRPSTGLWAIRGQDWATFGGSGDIPVPADYDGDGDTEIAIFRPSTGLWAIKGMPWQLFGGPGDIPVPADYDGDGDADIAVFRPSSGLWAINGQPWSQFGIDGDIPVPADYDGDGDADVAVFRPSNGLWAIQRLPWTQFGISGDIPVPLPAALHDRVGL